MNEMRFYAVQRRQAKGLSHQETTVFSFDDPMVMSDWIDKANVMTSKRRKNHSKVTRESLGPAASDNAVLWHVFNNQPGNNKVIRYQVAEPTVKKEKVDQGPWVNLKIPKGVEGTVLLKKVQDDYGREMVEIRLPDDLGMVKPAPYKNRRIEPHPVDLSGGTIRVMEKAKRPVDENGVKGWRKGVIKSMEDKDYFEVGYRRKSQTGDEWKVYVTLPDTLPDGSHRRVAVEVTTLDAALNVVMEKRNAPIEEKAPERTYPNPDMFFAEPMLDEDGAKRYVWHSDDGEHIIATHYLDEGVWTMESTRDDDPEYCVECTGESFEEAYRAHYELSKMQADALSIAGPMDSVTVYDDFDQLRISIGNIEEPSRQWLDSLDALKERSDDYGVPSDTARTVAIEAQSIGGMSR